MISFALTALAIGWKLSLVGVVCIFAFDGQNDLSLRYTNRKGAAVFAVFCICFGLAIFIWFSKHLPVHREFWTTWYFVDDVAVVSLAFGAATLIRLIFYALQNK